MSRLKYEDIYSIPGTLQVFDRELEQKTGCSLEELAVRASGIECTGAVSRVKKETLVGVVPVNAGEGRIRGFSDALMSIARHIGFQAVTTNAADVAGFAEGIDSGCTILLMADDNAFLAYNCKTGTLINNNPATAYGFVTALECMSGGLKKSETLVLGAGPIGRFSAKKLLERGSRVALYDIDRNKAEQAAAELKHRFKDTILLENNIRTAFGRYQNIIDATPALNIIDEADISEATVAVAPGVPHGLTEKALKKIGFRFLHDNLRIGTATMLIHAAFSTVSRR